MLALKLLWSLTSTACAASRGSRDHHTSMPIQCTAVGRDSASPSSEFANCLCFPLAFLQLFCRPLCFPAACDNFRLSLSSHGRVWDASLECRVGKLVPHTLRDLSYIFFGVLFLGFSTPPHFCVCATAATHLQVMPVTRGPICCLKLRP